VIASPNSASSYMFISGSLPNLSVKSSRKETQLVPLGFLISSTGT